MFSQNLWDGVGEFKTLPVGAEPQCFDFLNALQALLQEILF